MLISGTAIRAPVPEPRFRLMDVGSSRFLQPLQLSCGIRQAALGKEVADVAATLLEHAEDIARLHRFPHGKRQQARQDACRLGIFCQGGWNLRTLQRGAHAVAIIGLTENVLLGVEYALLYEAPPQQHRAGGMQAAHRRLDDIAMAGWRRDSRKG